MAFEGPCCRCREAKDRSARGRELFAGMHPIRSHESGFACSRKSSPNVGFGAKNARCATQKNRESALLWTCIHQQAGYHMHKSAGIVYLATFIVGLGILFSAVVLDAQRDRSHDRILPRNPSRQSTNTEQMVVNLSTPPAIRPAEFRDRGQIEPIARHTANAPQAIAPPVIPERAPDVSIAPWSIVTVTTSIARTLPGEDPKR